ncbi:hypothetical protein DY000_02007307 [Brassica cretica]|uniref:Uncharacterized protein n=2 Tax=Brassica cretica TaxID=69181 RepID=A0ABQ7C5R0_BRACR|nr:hypothetical protein DY000_02007307 [Brassica cretica]
MYEEAIIGLLEHSQKFTRILPCLRSYSRADIEDMVHASIDSLTRLLIDGGYKYLKKRLVTVKLLEDKLDEINFSQDLMREDFSQRLVDLDKTTTARFGMHQRSFNNLQNRMHVSAVDKEILRNQWTRGDVAIRSFIGTWFQMSKEDVDTCFPTSSHPTPY